MKTIFISDLHLDEKRPDITQALFRFLDKECIQASPKPGALYILGDFFETWIGDDNSSTLISEVKQHLKQLSTLGIQLYLLHGNRDFLIGNAFCAEVGASLIEDETVIQLNGEPVLLMHGDTLCTQDTAYLAFREMVRAKEWQQAFLAKPIEERAAIAAELRKTSQASANSKTAEIMDVTQQEVIEKLNKKQLKTLIHGHTHRPAVHELTIPENAKRYVLGDWDQFGWALIADSKGLHLNKFTL